MEAFKILVCVSIWLIKLTVFRSVLKDLINNRMTGSNDVLAAVTFGGMFQIETKVLGQTAVE